MTNCQKCGVDLDVDIDLYTIFCTACLDEAVAEADMRNSAIERGDTTVPNMTARERERVLAVRKEQRDAIAD